MDNSRCYHCERCCERSHTAVKNCRYRKTRAHEQEENDLYEQACNRLAMLFGRKHGWRFEGWSGYFDPQKDTWQWNTGGWALFGDFIATLDDIRADLMMDAPESEFIAFMDATLEESCRAEQEGRAVRRINYRSWLLGARFDMTDPDSEYVRMKREELERSAQALQQAKEELQRAIEEAKNKNCNKSI